MGFWMVAGLISVLVAAIVGLSLLRPHGGSAAAPNDDLKATRMRGDKTAAAASPGRTLVLAALALAVAGAFGLYRVLGAPGYPDLPIETRIALIEAARAERPSQAAAEAESPSVAREDTNPRRAEMVAQLRALLESNPDAPEELGLLAFEEARLGNYGAARVAQMRLIGVLGDAANAGHYIDLAEIQFMAAGGYVSPETEELLQEVLRRAPGNGAAQYYMGLMFSQQGRPDLGYPIWRDLLAASEPGDPWIGPIRARIEDVAALAGNPVSVEDLVQPPEYELPGPSARELEAALTQDAENRDEILETMVAGLAERLANLGGPPEDWVQLISGFLALDQVSAAQSVFDRALIVFAGSDAALAMIETAGAPLEASE
jgi:cytochrome c-type biogenesis protein CcmH